MKDRPQDRNPANRDPISKDPASQPIGTGVRAGAGGGVAGERVVESVDPVAEEAYWRDHHERQDYGRARPFADYSAAYAVGYHGYGKINRPGARFEDYEPELRDDYERVRTAAGPEWTEARAAARNAWNRLAYHHERLSGYSVCDHDGNAVGKVQCVWVNERGEPEFVGVKTGWLLGKTHAVPAHRANVSHTRELIRLPFAESRIKEAPSFDEEADLSDADVERIYSYYDLRQQPTRTPGMTRGAEDIRAGEPAREEEKRSMKLHEEDVKVGKHWAETGGVRLRKIIRTETVHRPVELKREDVVVERVPASGTKSARHEFKEDEIWVPLRHEEPHVEKDVRVREEVKLGKKTDVEHRDVAESVRKEDVQLEHQKPKDQPTHRR